MRRINNLVVWLWLSLAISPGLANATTYYVNKAGSDGNSCATAQSATDADAKLTIAGASGGMSCLAAGDTLLVGDGTYDEELASADFTTGTLANPIVIQSENSRGATIAYTGTITNLAMVSIPTDMSYITISGFILDGSSSATLTKDVLHIGQNGGGGGTSNITITDNEVDGGNIDTNCIEMGRDVVNPPDSHTITNNYIHSCGDSTISNQNHGIYPHGDNHVITGNTIEDIGGTSPTNAGGFCIHFNSSESNGYKSDDNIVHTNTCENSSNGIIISEGHRNLIYNNWIKDVAKDGLNTSSWASVAANLGAQDNEIYNNTVLNAGRFCFRHFEGGAATGMTTGNTFKNNICWDSVSGAIGDSTQDGVTASNNLCNSGCAYSDDPSFVSEVTPDFNIQSDSGAIGNGADLSVTFTTDFNGDTRTTPWDIGAYGYDIDGPPSPDLTLTLTTNTLSWSYADDSGVTNYRIYFACSSTTTPGRFFTVPKIDADIKKDGTGTYNDLTNRQIKIKQGGVECDPYFVRVWDDEAQIFSTEVEWSLP